MPTRRLLLGGLFATASCAAGAGDDPFVFSGGIGRRQGGPGMRRPADAAGGFPRATAADWWRVDRAVDGFSRLDEILPAAVSPAGGPPAPWRRAPVEPAIAYDGAAILGAGRFDLDGYLGRNPATGLLIARGDTILAERYQYARTDRQRLTSFSMAKTLVALLVGIAMAEGHIRSIDEPAEAHVPALRGSAYGATPLRHLLTMSSGVQFREDYDGTDDAARLSRLTTGGQGPGGAAAARQFDTRIAAPGTRWYYASAETFVLALVLRAAIGQSVASYFSDRVWRKIGAEADATWLVDRSGQEVGYMGFNAVLRDYARLGAMLAAGGQVAGQAVAPRDWVAAMTRAQVPPQATGRFFGYGFQTWVFPDGRTFALLGVRGQAMLIDPASRLVMVHTAVRADARDAGGADAIALWRGVRRGLAGPA